MAKESIPAIIRPVFAPVEEIEQEFEKIIFVSYRDSIMDVYSLTDRLVTLYA